MDICSECEKTCKEIERTESVSYNHRDRNVTDRFTVLVSDCCGEAVDCCGEAVKRINEEEDYV